MALLRKYVDTALLKKTGVYYECCSGSAGAEEEAEPAAAAVTEAEPKRGEDIPTVEDLPGVIGSEEEYARILRKPLQPLQEDKVEEPPEVSESEVKKIAGFFCGFHSRCAKNLCFFTYILTVYSIVAVPLWFQRGSGSRYLPQWQCGSGFGSSQGVKTMWIRILVRFFRYKKNKAGF
jgi:hypothetical protein